MLELESVRKKLKEEKTWKDFLLPEVKRTYWETILMRVTLNNQEPGEVVEEEVQTVVCRQRKDVRRSQFYVSCQPKVRSGSEFPESS